MKAKPIKILLYGMLLVFFACKSNTSKETVDETQSYVKEKPIVSIQILEQSSFKKQLLANGKLRALKKGDLSFQQSGKIIAIHSANGFSVSKGETLAELEKTTYLENLKSAKNSLDRAKLDMDDLLIGLGIDPADSASLSKEKLTLVKIKSGYLNASLEYDRALKNLEKCELIAPFSGKLANISQKVYEQTNGKAFCSLIDDSKFEVVFQVMENEIGDISLNDEVKVIPFAIDTVCIGKIAEINPIVDDNGLVEIKAVVQNPGMLLDGMNVRVLAEKIIPNQFVVPKEAVVLRDNFEVLFKIVNGIAYWNYVNTVYENTESFAVIPNPDKSTASLSVGDTIIVSGNLNLAHESEVEIK